MAERIDPRASLAAAVPRLIAAWTTLCDEADALRRDLREQMTPEDVRDFPIWQHLAFDRRLLTEWTRMVGSQMPGSTEPVDA